MMNKRYKKEKCLCVKDYRDAIACVVDAMYWMTPKGKRCYLIVIGKD